MENGISFLEAKKIVKSILKKFQIQGYEYDDLYLEGLLTATKAINEYEPKHGAKISTYIYLRVQRRYISLYRNTQAQKRKAKEEITLEKTTLEENGELYGAQLFESPQQERLIEKEEFLEQLQTEFEKILKEDEIEFINLHLMGLSVKEISESYNISEKQTSNKLYYIKNKLKKNKDKFEKIKKML